MGLLSRLEWAPGMSFDTYTIPWCALTRGVPASQLLSETRLAASRSEARRIIKERGLALNHVRNKIPDRLINADDLIILEEKYNPHPALYLLTQRGSHAAKIIIQEWYLLDLETEQNEQKL